MPRRRTGLEKQKRADGSATHGVTIRFTEAERARVRAAGDLAGPTFTEWARQLLLRETEEVERRLAAQAK